MLLVVFTFISKKVNSVIYFMILIIKAGKKDYGRFWKDFLEGRWWEKKNLSIMLKN
jgi:hypothetical protein